MEFTGDRFQAQTLGLGRIARGENISPGGPYLSLLFASRVLYVFPRADLAVLSLGTLPHSHLLEPLSLKCVLNSRN